MRALAATWVLLHHANVSASHFIGPVPATQGLISNGYLGVDFFFVLSGFIIAFSADRLLATGRGPGDYVRARLVRIYVPYLPVGLAMLALYMLFPSLSEGARSPGVLTSVTLLPSASPPALSVAWTLVHEILFYAAFATIFVSRRLLWAVLAAWAIAIGLHATAGAADSRVGLDYILAPINLCFLLGVVTHVVTRNGIGTIAAVAGLVTGLAILATQAWRIDPARWLLAVGFAGLIIFGASSWAQRRGPGPLALVLGAASYSIYLVHDPALALTVRILRRVAPATTPMAAFLLMSAVALGAGLAYYAVYERRALELARALLFPRAGGREVAMTEAQP